MTDDPQSDVSDALGVPQSDVSDALGVPQSDVTDALGVPESFDFEAHQAEAEDQYRRVRGNYEDFAQTIRDILDRSLNGADILVHSIEARAKGIASFGRKAAYPNPADPEQPKYPMPLKEITDLAAARVITFFLSSLQDADRVIASEFEIVEKNDRGGEASGEARLGYQSIHYLVKLKQNRYELPEYARFFGMTAELQVRTILQHAWAEIEHEIQYKAAVDVLPKEISRRFEALAGMLEIGDREFQALEDAHRELQRSARERVASGNLTDVEITPDSLRAFLDKKFGEDRRMRDVSYNWTTRLLKRLGFVTLKQLDHALAGYSADAISRILHGNRQGQLTRMEDVLLASMGQNYISRHPWASEEWHASMCERRIERLAADGIAIGNYDPALDTS